jgi:cobalamin biosynthesis Co2+ chelatase CbiK
MDQSYKCKAYNIETTEENIGKALKDRDVTNAFLSRSVTAQEIRARVDK